MQLIVYILAYPLLWIISKLPHRIFYSFSDFICFWVYSVAGYRKKVVDENLRLAFPEKTDKELHIIKRKFYSHLIDTFLEMVKTMDLSKEDVKKKYTISNIEVLQELEKTKSVLLVCSHYANWEWNVSINNYVNSKGYAVYQKIENKYFEALVKKIRSRWNTTPITQQDTVKTVMRNKQNNVIGVFGMVSDQSPMVSKAQYWSKFMGIKVPVFTGAEALARKLDLAVVFLKVSKVKRGYYNAEFIPITESGANTEEREITDRFLRETEKQIEEAPEYYLWSHRRWKHRHKVPQEFQ
ncbi:lysophospholipid acyltransferase family protein [Spongiimicrobium sp. 3-5]|uniref:lysophospholipid acyltransferase family protein n=1 Tax=Spongiimicrobium sp. 3-5 TaxID=3332596 RepID=UPI00397F2574